MEKTVNNYKKSLKILNHDSETIGDSLRQVFLAKKKNILL